MSALPRHKWTEAEYLVFERASDAKHEYYRGEIYDMAGASDEHNTIYLNVALSLHAQVRKRPCRIYHAEMRVAVPRAKLYTYPDIVAVCGERVFSDDKPDTLVNPTVIIEVLSPSTENYDKSEKSQHYRTLESLQEYVLISQDKVKIEHYVRQADDKWSLHDVADLQTTLELASIQCTLALADVYEKVEFDAADDMNGSG